VAKRSEPTPPSSCELPSAFRDVVTDADHFLFAHSYNKGASVEYKGKRDVQTLKNFALKAVSA